MCLGLAALDRLTVRKDLAMIGIDTLYTGPQDFEALLGERHFGRIIQCLVKVFAAGMKKCEAVRTAQEIKRLLPRAFGRVHGRGYYILR